LNIVFLFISNVNFLFVDAKGGENMKISNASIMGEKNMRI
jgi:hypothetical protein